MKIAILDDYQNVALEMADLSALSESAEITAFNDCRGVYSLPMPVWRLSLYGFSDAWGRSSSSTRAACREFVERPLRGKPDVVREPN